MHRHPKTVQWNVPQLEVLASLQRELLLGLALRALKTQDDLLGSLGLLVEDRLGLTTITTLLAVITTLSLGEQRSFSGLVLGDLVLGVCNVSVCDFVSSCWLKTNASCSPCPCSRFVGSWVR